MNMKLIYTLLLLAALITLSASQTKAQSGIGTTTPDSHAMLDITSTSGGLLLPRLTATQQATLAASLTSANAGMLVTDATTGKTICWGGTAWTNAAGITATTPLTISSTNTISLNPGTAVGDLITWDGINWVNTQPAVQHFSISQDNRQPYLTINFCIALSGIFPSRSSSDPFLSEIEMYGFSFAPKGWALCNGQLLPINQNAALFSLLGTTYGGNGINTFALPDLRSRVPMHMGQGAGLSPFVEGQTGGLETNTISR